MNGTCYGCVVVILHGTPVLAYNPRFGHTALRWKEAPRVKEHVQYVTQRAQVHRAAGATVHQR